MDQNSDFILDGVYIYSLSIKLLSQSINKDKEKREKLILKEYKNALKLRNPINLFA